MNTASNSAVPSTGETLPASVADVIARYPGADCAPRPDVLPVVMPDHAKPDHYAWAVVVGDLFGTLIASGFTILKVDNGGGWVGGDTLELLSEATACDDAYVAVMKNGVRFSLFLVFGNAPSELVADNSCNDTVEGREIDSLLSAWSDSWLAHDECPTWAQVSAGFVKA